MREKLDELYGELSPEVRERTLELLPLITADCLRPSETWPHYMPDLSVGYTAFPDYPWKRSLWGAFAFEAIAVAVLIAKGHVPSPFAA